MSPRRFPCPRRLVLLALLLGTVLSTAGASELYFRVSDIEFQRGGTINAGLYASEEGYLEPGYAVAAVIVEIDGDTAEGVFTDLPAGRYVVAILHDENGDSEMQKRGALGIPEEGYGFSGPSKAKMKPPKFDNAAVTLDGGDSVEVDVFMKYM